jgi:hypothetical protein
MGGFSHEAIPSLPVGLRRWLKVFANSAEKVGGDKCSLTMEAPQRLRRFKTLVLKEDLAAVSQ